MSQQADEVYTWYNLHALLLQERIQRDNNCANDLAKIGKQGKARTLKQMPVTSNVTRSLEIHNSKHKSQNYRGNKIHRKYSSWSKFLVEDPGTKQGNPKHGWKLGSIRTPETRRRRRRRRRSVGTQLVFDQLFAILGSSNRWRSRIMAHNPSTLSHVDCKEEEENLFSVSPSFSLSPFSHTTPGTRSNLFILI
jgi:hypothetical protein